MLKPFFINTNLCYGPEDCQTSAQFFDNVAGNTGNSYIGYSIIKILYGKLIKVPEIKNIFSYDFKNQDALIHEINTKYSHVIFCLQDQLRNSQSYGIRPNWKKITEFISRIDKPLLVISLGTNSFKGEGQDYYKNFDPELVRFLHVISEKVYSLGVRGLSSERVLHKLGIKNAAPVGCPAFFEMGINRKPIQKKLPVPTAILSPSDGGRSVLQDEQTLFRCLYWPAENFSIPKSLRLPNLLSLPFQKGFASIELWKKFVSNFDYNYSSRMHGGILSLNCGIPAVMTNDDLRSHEMCSLFKIPYVPGGGDPIELYKQADFGPMNNAYPTLYKNFMSFSTENGFDQTAISALHKEAESLPEVQPFELPINDKIASEVERALKSYKFYVPTKILFKLLLKKLTGKRH
ncbi:MAG TPA: hypothetical protein DCP52_02105 [Elusimicrobia bacterium]|nr:hypothetical protein [Elusimicrobiota bacterium]